MLDLTKKERTEITKVYAVLVAKAGLITSTAAALRRDANTAELNEIITEVKAATDLFICKYKTALLRQGITADAGAINELRQQLQEEIVLNAFELIQSATEELKRLVYDEQKGNKHAGS